MVSGGASGLLPPTLGKNQLALLRGPQTLRSLCGITRGRYRHSRVVALQLLARTRGSTPGP
eukprot:4159974-Amphidinium_carterae.1